MFIYSTTTALILSLLFLVSARRGARAAAAALRFQLLETSFANLPKILVSHVLSLDHSHVLLLHVLTCSSSESSMFDLVRRVQVDVGSSKLYVVTVALAGFIIRAAHFLGGAICSSIT